MLLGLMFLRDLFIMYLLFVFELVEKDRRRRWEKTSARTNGLSMM